jgi:phosphatidylinositol phospholipase C beta
LPSPTQLKNKILLKNKKRTTDQSQTPVSSESSLEAPVVNVRDLVAKANAEHIEFARQASSEVEKGTQGPSTSSSSSKSSKKLTRASDSVKIAEREMTKALRKGVSAKALTHQHANSGSKVNQMLSDLILYCESVPFESFAHSKSTHSCTQMSSFSEKKAFGLAETQGKDWFHHNIKHLSRIYPNGLRFDSSNYDPMPLWSSGCQLVALNYQTPDVYLQLNRAMFERNGGVGYVLKPKPLQFRANFNPVESTPINGVSAVTVRISLRAALNLPVKRGEKISFIVESFGLPVDCKVCSKINRK